MLKNDLFYNIGLDIGTNSVGYSVTDMNGKLLKIKGKNFWGVRLFEQGKTAKVRRIYRSNRRRKLRRKQRIRYLQEFLNEDLNATDSDFLHRLELSFRHITERNNTYNLLIGDSLNDQTYYKKYPTIYHLRKDLVYSQEKKDIRLVYLALHHIFKYRGNFLYDGQNFDIENTSINNDVAVYVNYLTNQNEIELDFTAYELDEYCNFIMNDNVSKIDKSKKLLINTKNSEIIKSMKEFSKAILGYKADFSAIFFFEEKNQDLVISLKDDYDEDLITTLLDNNFDIFLSIKRIYSTLVLKSIRGDYKYISEGMISRFNKHKKDLVVLKRLIKQHFNDQYNYLFRPIKESKITNYANYIANPGSNSREDLYKTIKKIIDTKSEVIKENNDYTYCLQQIENDNFLKILNIKENGEIPYQLHKEELIKIIENQANYYPGLMKNAQKIIATFEFRIPYYVGPLNQKSQFAWVHKDKKEKIYPWNFEGIVNLEKSAEEFITRMTNKCTYLLDEDVLPKYSLLISEFDLLDELNKIRVNDKLLSKDIKNKIINKLFKEKKKVTSKTLINFLKTELPFKEYKIEGLRKENEFAASLTSYIDFKSIFTEITEENLDMIEDIILWITLFTDKKILKAKIKKIYPSINDEQLKKIEKLNYKGWSRLSKKLLVGIKSKASNGTKFSIMDRLRNSNDNFMQIISNQELDFYKIIENKTKKVFENKITLEDLDEINGSPAIKKSIWQTIKIVDEIIDILGTDPVKIYIEVTRSNQKSIRTKSRVDKLLKIYQEIQKQTKDFNKTVFEELKNEKKKNNKLDDEKLFLYYIQNGKCMYSEQTLDIDKLHLYEIDHIMPQSIIKDDSIENKALVLRECNQQKGDSLFLHSKVIESRKGFWYYLHKHGLISSKKLNNLLRTEISSDEMKKFINRQLVETSQIIINVSRLLHNYYNTDVTIVKSQLTAHLRKSLGLYKIREINNYHHAHDAFLTTILGEFCTKRFRMTNYGEYIRLGRDRKHSSGLIINTFKKTLFDDDSGEIIWDAEKAIANIKKSLNYKDCFISRKAEEQTGEFYNQTICGKKLGKVELKKGLDTLLYGGYSGVNEAYSIVVEYKNKNKILRKLIPITIQEANLIGLNKQKLNIIIAEKINNVNFVILREKVLKNQLALLDGHPIYITSTSEIVNAKQLTVPKELTESIYRVLNDKMEDTVEDNEMLNTIYKMMQDKIEKEYPIYATLANKVKESHNLFLKLDFTLKCKFIKKMMSLTAPSPATENFSEFNMPLLKDRPNRINKSINVDKLEFIDNSVTGIYQTKVKYGI